MAAADPILDQESRPMTAEHNFVRVMYALFEPNLKLRVTISTPYEANSNFEIAVDHDPAIDADKLTMPAPSWMFAGPPESRPQGSPTEIPFWSNRRRLVARLSGDLLPDADRLRFRLKDHGGGFGYDASRLEEATGVEPGEGFELIRRIIEGAIDLPYWDDRARMEARDGVEPARTVELHLQRSLAEQLAAGSRFSFEDAGGGDVLVWRREARL